MRVLKQRGFSLMEMMIVLLIISIVAAATAPMITKKMARSAGSNDSPWVFTGMDDSIAFNMSGDNDATVVIGATSLPRGWDKKARLFIDCGNNDNVAHVAYGNGETEPFLLTADPARGRVGFSNEEIPQNSVAFGSGQTLSGTSSVTIGFGASTNSNSVAIGSQAIANNTDSIAIGREAEASDVSAIAIGSPVKADENAIAFGKDIVASSDSIAIGNSIETRYSSINIGNSIENSDSSSIVIGNSTQGTYNSITIGNVAGTAGLYDVAIGYHANTNSTQQTPITWGASSIAIGQDASTGGAVDIAIGYEATTGSVNGGIAIGYRARAIDGGTAIGSEAKSLGSSALAIGDYAEAKHSNSIAIGYDAKTTADNQIVLGRSSDTVSIPGNLGSSSDTIYIPGNLVIGKNLYVGTNITPSGAWGYGSSLYLKLSDGTMYQVSEAKGENNFLETITSISSSSIPTLSDKRLKNVGEKYTAGLAELKKLDFFNFTFKKDETKTPHVGVMAQDLKKVFPDAVTKGEDGYLRIRWEDMFYAVINAVKELDNKITEIVKNITDINSTIEKQNKIIEAQQKTIEELLERVEKLEAGED